MTRSELVAYLVQKRPDLSQQVIQRIVDVFFQQIITTLEQKGRVELRGLGSFSLRKREPRTARNPRDGSAVKVGERYSIYFRAGKLLRESVNR